MINMKLSEILNTEEAICKWIYDNEVKGEIIFTYNGEEDFLLLEYDAERVLLRPLTSVEFEDAELSIPLTELLKMDVEVIKDEAD